MITIYDWFGYELPPTERYRLIREAGFDGVLLWWSEFRNRGDYRSGPQIARNAGLVIENIRSAGGPFFPFPARIRFTFRAILYILSLSVAYLHFIL